jgi:exosome complex component CSL4
MKDQERRLLLPGDEIGTAEEYIAGEGTFEQDGKIFSSNTGYLDIDKNEMIVRVKPATSTPVILKINDLVYGVVYDIKGSMVLVNVSKVIGEDRDIAMGDTMGSLHISKIQEEYLKDIGEAFKVSDIVRAKVIQVEPSLQLTTNGRNQGVIVANCIECQMPLEKKGRDLICPQCETKYRKKLAEDYGTVKLSD